MDCVNHPGKAATAYCQNCGKPLCTDCIASGILRPAARGMILCSNCINAWQAANPFVPPPPGAPSPALAGVLGLIPGVGAMYNGQFIKGLVHLAIFAVLVSAAHVYGVLGWFVAGWIFYQVFEAYQTAKARRDGDPLPDPLGLNDVSNWFSAGGRAQPGAQSGTEAGAAGQGAASSYSPSSQAGNQPPAQLPFQGQYQSPYQAPFQGPYAPPGFTGPGIPPVPPPIPPVHWRRKEPIGAVILIALGLLFLMGRLDLFSVRVFEFGGPVLLIGLGVWLIVRRLQDSQGSSQRGQK